MVRLVVSPHRGNNARSFPYTGYLGLTPVTLQGSVRLETEEDGLQLEAASVVVRLRCYEAATSTGGLGTKGNSVRTLYEVSETLWTAHSASPKRLWAPIGEFKGQWRLVMPADAPCSGALSAMNMKSWRVWWALEAVVYHKPAGILGDRLLKSFQVNLQQHGYPQPGLPLEWTSAAAPRSSLSPTNLISYTASTNTDSYGPDEPFSVQLRLSKTAADQSLVIKRVTVELRREMTIYPASLESSPSSSSDGSTALATPDCFPELYPPVHIAHENEPDSSSDSIGGGSDGPSYFSFKSATQHQSPDDYPPATHAAEPFAAHLSRRAASSSKAGRKDELVVLSLTKAIDEGEWSRTGQCLVSLDGRTSKSQTLYHWSVGETCSTVGCTIRFYVTIRLTVKSKQTPHIDLPAQTVGYKSVSAADRAAARDAMPKVYAVQQAEASLFRQDGMVRSISVDHMLTTASSHHGGAAPDRSPKLGRTEDFHRRRFASSTAGMNNFPSPVPSHASFVSTASTDSNSTQSSASTLRDFGSSVSTESLPLVPRRASGVLPSITGIPTDLSARRASRRVSVTDFLLESHPQSCEPIVPDESRRSRSRPPSMESSTLAAFAGFSMSAVPEGHRPKSTSEAPPMRPRPRVSSRTSRGVGPKDVDKSSPAAKSRQTSPDNTFKSSTWFANAPLRRSSVAAGTLELPGHLQVGGRRSSLAPT